MHLMNIGCRKQEAYGMNNGYWVGLGERQETGVNPPCSSKLRCNSARERKQWWSLGPTAPERQVDLDVKQIQPSHKQTLII